MNYYFFLPLREMNQGSGSGYIAGAILLILVAGERISRANGLGLLKGQWSLFETRQGLSGKLVPCYSPLFDP